MVKSFCQQIFFLSLISAVKVIGFGEVWLFHLNQKNKRRKIVVLGFMSIAKTQTKKGEKKKKKKKRKNKI